LEQALRLAGLECDSATDGADALGKITSRHQLVVTDLRMPEQNGHSLAIELLKRQQPPIVVALTGIREPRLAADLCARGVREVVYKPVDYVQFAEKLKHMIKSRNVDRAEPAPEQTACFSSTSTAIESQASDHRLHGDRWQLEQLFMQCGTSNPWIRAAFQWIGWDAFSGPAAKIYEAVKQQVPSSEMLERRQKVRINVMEPGIVIPLSDALEPAGRPFKAIVRDLSSQGIGLAHSDRIATPNIALSWRAVDQSPVTVVGRVLRSNQLKDYWDYYVAVTA
jgi:CheY-like chemotaxis protein